MVTNPYYLTFGLLYCILHRTGLEDHSEMLVEGEIVCSLEYKIQIYDMNIEGVTLAADWILGLILGMYSVFLYRTFSLNPPTLILKNSDEREVFLHKDPLCGRLGFQTSYL